MNNCIVCQRKAELAANRERKLKLKQQEEMAKDKNKEAEINETQEVKVESKIEVSSGRIDIDKIIAERRAKAESGKNINK